VTADVLNTVITDLATLLTLPEGAGVVDDCGDLYQRRADGLWYGALMGGDNGSTDNELLVFKPLLLVWLPPEVTR